SLTISSSRVCGGAPSACFCSCRRNSVLPPPRASLRPRRCLSPRAAPRRCMRTIRLDHLRAIFIASLRGHTERLTSMCDSRYARIGMDERLGELMNDRLIRTDGGVDANVLVVPRPRGFCAGLVRAIDIDRLALVELGTAIYERKLIE